MRKASEKGILDAKREFCDFDKSLIQQSIDSIKSFSLYNLKKPVNQSMELSHINKLIKPGSLEINKYNN